jgi:hypothetical protein
MDVNVALLPEAGLERAVVDLSRRLAAACGSTLVLDAVRGPFAHLTLYLTGFPADAVDVIPGLVGRTVAHLGAPELAVRGAAVSPQGAVLLTVEKTPALAHLHAWMIHKLNPLRMQAVPQIWAARRARYGAAELRRLSAVGFPQALEAWSPHFTVGRVPPALAGEARRIAARETAAGFARAIGVGAVGEHGTFVKLLGEAPLG